MEFKDYYDILGVEADVEPAAIKKAYRRLARKFHPDVSSENDAESQFKEVSEAYEVLGDTDKRAEYDQLRSYGRKGEQFSPPPGWSNVHAGAEVGGEQFSEFFDNIFGRHGRSAHRSSRGFTSSEDFYSTRGQDIEMDLPVFLEDTLVENSQTIEYSMPHYDASGRLADVKKTLKVKIPKGAIDGERIRLRGQGAPGYGEGAAGDLYLRVKLVPHPLFDVIGKDLSLTLPIAPWEAVLGAKVEVPTLTGKINLSIAANAEAGTKLRVKGKGLAGRGDPGDLFVVLKIVTPQKSDAQSQNLWRQLAARSNFDPRKDLEVSS